MHVAAQQQQQQALHSPTAHGWAICSKHTADPTLDTTTRAAVEKKKKGMQQSALWWFCCGIAPAPKGNVKARRHGKAREARVSAPPLAVSTSHTNHMMRPNTEYLPTPNPQSHVASPPLNLGS